MDISESTSQVPFQVQRILTRATDAATSSGEFQQLPDPFENAAKREKWEFHLRQLGEKMKTASLEYLAKAYDTKQIDVVDLMDSLHILSAPGWQLVDWPDEKTRQEVNFRPGHPRQENSVYFGDTIPIVPPDYQHLDELTLRFSQKLAQLTREARTSDVKVLSTWAYMMVNALHRYPDVNGRVAKGTVDFLNYYLHQQRHLEYAPANFPSTSTDTSMTAAVEMDRAMCELGIFPVKKARDGSENPFNLWKQYEDQGKEQSYFNQVRHDMIRHIDSIQTVETLHQLPQIVNLSKYIDRPQLLKPGQTRSLVAEEGVQAFQHELSQNANSRPK